MIAKLRLLNAADNVSPSNNTDTLGGERELTVGFHPGRGEFWFRQGLVMDHTSHAVLILQVGGEAQDAAHCVGAV